jgi:hypothetical protein
MIADGRVRPVIGARFPLAEAQEAHRAAGRRRRSGKVLLTVRVRAQPSDASARTSWSTSAIVE